MDARQGELAPEQVNRPPTTGRWVVLWVLVAVAFVSGIGVSQDEFIQDNFIPGRLAASTLVPDEVVPALDEVVLAPDEVQPAPDEVVPNQEAVKGSEAEIAFFDPVPIEELPLHGNAHSRVSPGVSAAPMSLAPFASAASVQARQSRDGSMANASPPAITR